MRAAVHTGTDPVAASYRTIAEYRFNAEVDLSADGRFFSSDWGNGQARLDLDTGQVDLSGLMYASLSGDGSTYVAVRDRRVVVDDLATAGDAVLPELPDGFLAESVNAVSDDGETILVVGIGAEGRVLWVFDATTGSWSRVDTRFGAVPGLLPGTAMLAGDGRVIVADAVDPFSGHVRVWVLAPTGPEVVGVAERVRLPNEGDSGVFDVSSDGRFVLFWSQLGLRDDGTPVGGLYVHDRQAALTTLVPVTFDARPVFDWTASISDDGQRVAYSRVGPLLYPLTSVPTNIAAVVDMRSGRETVLTRTPGIESTLLLNEVEISGNGRRVVFTEHGTDRPRYVLTELSAP